MKNLRYFSNLHNGFLDDYINKIEAIIEDENIKEYKIYLELFGDRGSAEWICSNTSIKSMVDKLINTYKHDKCVNYLNVLLYSPTHIYGLRDYHEFKILRNI